MPVPKLVQRIREEFEEVPGLAVTIDEAARFFAIDRITCEDVLTQLHSSKILVKEPDGRYRRASVV